MDCITNFKHNLCKEHPILHKTGHVYLSCDPFEILRQNEGKKVLILMVGVQGCGKTTYCSKHFSSVCNIVNPDQILLGYCNSIQNISISEINKLVYTTQMEQIRNGLKNGIVVLDAASINFTFRMHILEAFEGMYDKSIIIALNPKKGTIKRQILGQLSERIRPNLWEDVDSDLEKMKLQLDNNIFQMGVDELYVV